MIFCFPLVLIVSEQGWEVRPGGGAAGWFSGRFFYKINENSGIGADVGGEPRAKPNFRENPAEHLKQSWMGFLTQPLALVELSPKGGVLVWKIFIKEDEILNQDFQILYTFLFPLFNL